MKNVMSLLVFAAAALLAAILPGRSAEATTCDDPLPSHIYLELESVTIDGVSVKLKEETWAHLEPWYDWRSDTVDRLEFHIDRLWNDSWLLGGRYERNQK